MQASQGSSRQTMLNRFRKISKIGHGIKKFTEFIIVDITNQAISQCGP
jgi:hypothetical protein